MSYVEDKFYYEDWEVDDGDDVSIVSIVNDFMAIPMDVFDQKTKTFSAEFEPLEYWVEMDGVGCISEWQGGGSYEDCLEWIRDNFVNHHKMEIG